MISPPALRLEQYVELEGGRGSGWVVTYRFDGAGEQLCRVRLVGADGAPADCVEVPASRCSIPPSRAPLFREGTSHG